MWGILWEWELWKIKKGLDMLQTLYLSWRPQRDSNPCCRRERC